MTTNKPQERAREPAGGGVARAIVLLLTLIGCLAAGWLGGRAGRYLQLADGDLRPAPSPHIHISGPNYLEAADHPATRSPRDI